jgi:hypothetical protein
VTGFSWPGGPSQGFSGTWLTFTLFAIEVCELFETNSARGETELAEAAWVWQMRVSRGGVARQPATMQGARSGSANKVLVMRFLPLWWRDERA